MAAKREAHSFTMPAEWEPHAATWLAWPHNRSDWPGKYDAIPFVYAEMIRHLSRVETVHLLVNDEKWEEKARKQLALSGVDAENVKFHRFPTNRVWTRDSGPIFVRDGRGDMTVTNWRFNAWAKYDDWQQDDKLPAFAARKLKMPTVEPMAEVNDKARRVVLEGGSIDVNGRGTMLTTAECLLDCEVQARNPGMSREQLAETFRQYLGVEKVIWLEKGIVGDDTHGHVDDIARFVSEDTVLCVVEPDRDDANYEILRANADQLKRETTADGKRLNVVEIPMPAPVSYRGQRLPASYANFYIANQIVLVPVFNDPNDRVALNTLADLMPDRAIVPIYCGDFIWGLGAIHCCTQQQPK